MLYFLFYGSFSKSKQFPQVEQPNQREKETKRERESHDQVRMSQTHPKKKKKKSRNKLFKLQGPPSF